VPAMWSAAGEGEALWFLGTLAIVRLPGEAVGDRFALIEFLFPHGASPPRHTHVQDESYIVLDGSLTVVAGDDRFVLGPGAAGAVPIRVPHTFRVDSPSARVLVLCSVPAAEPTLPPPDTPRPAPEELERLFARHGQVTVGPPLRPED
jgi:quercetin dioxygenase-like cupin family protein